MGINISAPSGLLSQYVKQYWAIDEEFVNGKSHTQRIIPNGLMDIIFYSKDMPYSLDPNKSVNHSSILTGQLNDFYDIKVSGKLSLFSISFYPHGLSMFFDIPVNEFYNNTVPLNLILKDTLNQLEDSLSISDSFINKIQIVEKFLLNMLQKTTTKYETNRIQDSIILINNSKGLISIEKLASKACLSRKQYERTFAQYIGTTPKKFLKIVRFQNAIYTKSTKTNTNLTDLTYQCGYFDQAHMTNDFTKLSGLSPKYFFRSQNVFSDYFQ